MSECCDPKLPENGSFDLAVIGAGSAGFSAAITAADQGAQVALIGQGTIGGTCVNVGCVPSKALIRAAEAVHHADTASRFAGISAQGRLDDWAALRVQKDELVTSLRQAKYLDLLPAYNSVAYLEGRASIGNGGVVVDDRHIKADRVIIATGSHEFLPPIPGIQDVGWLSSTTAFEMDALPRSMIILGGGYIGCELAQMFGRLGVKVTIIFRSRLVPEAEPEISAALAGYFTDEGITVQKVDAYEQVKTVSGGVALSLQTEGQIQTLEAEKLLLTAGRSPNTEGLALAEAGIGCNKRGGIKVDGQMRTTKDGVYAAGDVTGRDQFVYMAAYGAKIAAKNALNGNTLAYDSTVMPAVVFTDPQIASVGRTESEARAQGHDVRTSVLSLDNVPRALAARDTRGLIKLIADAGTRKLLGAHILAPEGADSIQTAALAIKAGMTYDELGSMIFPYLTTVEGLKLAAQTFDMDVKKLSCCAG